MSLLNGIEKCGGDERRVSRRWAVSICCVVGPDGLDAAEIEESETEDGEAGGGDWEERV